jgi:glycerol-3-phosphate dehydrogenase (NAD(P)+)
MKIIVIGAGAWGTALAMAASRQSANSDQVTLWVRDEAQRLDMQLSRFNARYLPGQVLPQSLKIQSGSPRSLSQQVVLQDLVIVATPMAGLREQLHLLAQASQPVAWVCKGFEPSQDLSQDPSQGLLAHEIQAQIAPNLRAGVLSGPSFALEVAQARPTALVAASAHASVREALAAAFHSPSLRVYANDDLVGVEVGGAVKNVMAIAAGLCDGLDLGLNARAALITRGLAEMTRLGLALGAKMETFMGLSGLGDLVLTATGDLSRNRKVGALLAQGQTLTEAISSLGHVAEGVACARTVLLRAKSLGVQMPITQAVVDLLDGKINPVQAVSQLMGRDPASEARSF